MSGSNSSSPDARATLEPVSLTVHSVPTPGMDGDAARRTTLGRMKMLLVLAVCAAPVVASYLTYFVIRPQGRNNYSELITPTRGLPVDLTMKTLSGETVKPSDLRGQWLFIVVADAACDALCERHLFLQRQLREALGGEKGRVDKLWLIPDDGAPRPEVIQAISAIDPPTVLRVPRADLSRWLVPARDHQLAEHLYIVDPMGQWMMRTPFEPDPAKVKRDIDRLLRASASWDRPGR